MSRGKAPPTYLNSYDYLIATTRGLRDRLLRRRGAATAPTGTYIVFAPDSAGRGVGRRERGDRRRTRWGEGGGGGENSNASA